jgi:anaerobic glycerol-3-phosphate dehydrogenase
MSGSMFSPESGIDTSDPKLAELLKTPEGQQIASMLATGSAARSQGQRNPYDTLSQMSMQRMQQQQQQMIAPPSMRPQVQRGQQANVMSPYDELMKMQQMQMMRQRPQSLL